MSAYGFHQSDWNLAKQEARSVLIERAKVRGFIPYSDLARKICAIHLDHHDPRFFHLLGELSSEEDAAGRGMLSVIVVHKFDDMQPGPGFFKLANDLGRDTSDTLKCWVEEFRKVHGVWSPSNHSRPETRR